MATTLLAASLCGHALAGLGDVPVRSDDQSAPMTSHASAFHASAREGGDSVPYGNARRKRSPHAAFGPAAATQTGHATYYHDRLQGRRTSSGERYDRDDLTAAHRTLPLGTLVRVTNLANSRSVMVRVNDRGPFIRNRLIDLSRAAADRLGYRLRGSAPVAVEVVEPAVADASPTSSR